MKKILILFILIVVLLNLIGCKENKISSSEVSLSSYSETSSVVLPSQFTDKTYTYEKEGFPDQFNITINSDGTFSYYEGHFSSWIGTGEWTLDGNTITLTEPDYGNDGNGHIHYFIVGDGYLEFIAQGSTRFTYVNVKDGERFIENPYGIVAAE